MKDESSRLGLPAFKFLGASWAISRLLGGGSDVASLARGAREQGIGRLTTATDGNHGRAFARMAALVGLQATIYIPASMRAARPEAIAGEGADPDGSSAVARWVIDGYSTLFAELDAQLPAAAAIDTVLLQTGVGAFAAAGVR